MNVRKKAVNGTLGSDLSFYKSIIEKSPSGYAYNRIVLDGNGNPCDYEFVEVNAAFENLTGKKRSDIIGRKFTESFQGLEKGKSEWIRLCGDVAMNGGELDIEEYSMVLGKWYKVIVFSPENMHFAAHFIDITKEKEHLSEIQKNKELISNILEGTNVGTWTWNVETGETVFNERMAQIIGYTLDEMLPVSITTFRKYLHSEDMDKFEAELKRVFGRELEYYDIESRMMHKNGNPVWIQGRGKVTSWTDDGKPLVMNGTITEITERKNLEIRLQENEEKFRNIFLAERDSIFLVYKVSGSILEVNDAACSSYGYSHGEMMRLKNIDLSAEPEKTRAAAQEFQASIPLRYHKKKDGSVFPVDINSSLFVLKNRDVMLHHVRDISEKKAYEDNLKKSELQMREILENSLDASYKRNFLTKPYDYLSPVFKRISGYAASELNALTEETLMNLIHPDDLPDVERAIAEYISDFSGTAYNVTYRFRHKEGHYVWFYDQFIIVRDDCGQSIARIGSVKDITEKRLQGLELIKAKNDAEEANNAKSNFLANMSHEIRTPMNGFLGMIQLMERSELTAEQRELMEIAKTSAKTLLILINDILDYSRIEAGKMSLDKIAFHLGTVISETMSLFKPSAENAGLSMEVFFDKDVHDNLVGDPFRLRQIISNLLGNSIKFTNEGRIDISVKRVETQNDKDVKLEFAVKDTGMGIHPDKMGLLFKRFSQVDAANKHAYGGSGLGLSICKGLVEKMGGEIWVESTEGIGSRFCFTCVFEKAGTDAASMEHAKANQSEGKKDISILLVEDDVVCRKVVELFAREKDWRVAFAENGKKAVDVLGQDSFDIVLMDLQMPIMNGYEATAIIRESERSHEMHTPIIAMTAFAIKGDRMKCLEAGMDDYLSKPVDVDEFYNMVEKWTGINAKKTA